MARSEFKFELSGTRSPTTIRSHNLFDASYVEPPASPIDIYERNMLVYKRLVGSFTYNPSNSEYTSLASVGNEEWQKLSNLLILGFISSVEGYVRGILRRTLLLDGLAKNKSYSRSVTYGAAVHHNKDFLPEAIFEECSFHCSYNIKETLKDVTGINLKNSSKNPTLSAAFSNYDFIGQLRHCVVHRSGLFGSKNALSLGLDEYHKYIEKPIKLDVAVVQDAAVACDNLVKELNDVLFCEFLNRSIDQYEWKGDFRIDRKYFVKYFDVFSPVSNQSLMSSCYKKFRDAHNLKYRRGAS